MLIGYVVSERSLKNLKGERHTPSRKPSLFSYQKLTEEQIAEFRSQGYLVIGRTLNDEGLQKIHEEVMAVWWQEKDEFKPGGTWLQNALLSDIHHRAPLVRDYYFEGPLVDIAEQLIGPNVKAATCQLTFKMRGNTQTFGWHQDNGYGELDPYTAVSTLTALDDMDEENGCLWVIPGSNRWGQMIKFVNTPVLEREINLEVDETKAVPVPFQAGEAFIMHCWTLHRSGGNLSRDRDRRILFMRYADTEAVEVYNDRKPRGGPLTSRHVPLRRSSAIRSGFVNKIILRPKGGCVLRR